MKLIRIFTRYGFHILFWKCFFLLNLTNRKSAFSTCCTILIVLYCVAYHLLPTFPSSCSFFLLLSTSHNFTLPTLIFFIFCGQPWTYEIFTFTVWYYSKCSFIVLSSTLQILKKYLHILAGFVAFFLHFMHFMNFRVFRENVVKTKRPQE